MNLDTAICYGYARDRCRGAGAVTSAAIAVTAFALGMGEDAEPTMPPIKEWRAKSKSNICPKKVDLYEMQLDISQNNPRVAARLLKIHPPFPAHSLKANV